MVASGDPIGEMSVFPGGYQWMMHIVVEESAKINAPVCALLEGGYFPEGVALSAEFCLKVNSFVSSTMAMHWLG